MTTALADLDWPLRTDRLELRPARSEDADAVWPWYRLPEVQEWTTTLSTSVEEHQQWWEDTLGTSVVGLLEGRIVAAGKIDRQDAWSQADMARQARGQQAELGWVLDPGVQGRGLGTEFAAALLDLAVDGLGVRRVEASCFADNLASRRVMEKIGMRCEGVFVEESLHRSGRWLDGMTFAILAREHRSTDT
ncbi:MAG: GNAT family N-acetyltransferase [Brachybacterium sp.]|uniref:GNAT family N-acetyltransferase n=1 Tax=Brachybacterium sp. TaxID=1891286 RepID=UPI00264A6424|nr:GNAT family N-acetyltransferase [Brachybacterium sp.]MDN6303936.1 GNAT family N-acetyltransferase [Brachybacterium sp.]MDN6329510.1 GNAT family N-acetyltransferase [Brachybacterium sp.]MDN6399138.1 GNAT family N-acetyltransferase [Brachybacterium sp.]